jgi:hypothetical protein
MDFSLTTIPLKSPVSSLVWKGDDLVDLTRGGESYSLDGSHRMAKLYWGFRFDAALTSPSGQYSVIYERLGTKGLLLDGLKIVRELNRSYYHAEVYEYPITFAKGQDGQDLLIHCPDDYCRIDVEVVASGERLSMHPERKPQDVFHSRLDVSPDGRWLISAGWVWHPFDVACVFDLGACLADPRNLDSTNESQPDSTDEVNIALFDSDSKLLLSSNVGAELIDEPNTQRLRPGQIGLWNPTTRSFEKITTVGKTLGSLMPLGRNHVVSFYEHPKIVDLVTGQVVQEWPGVNSGKQSSSIIHHLDTIPPMAKDPANYRFAVADKEKITVFQAHL